MAVTIEDLYRTDQGAVVALAALILGSREAAEDVVQDCFLRLGNRPHAEINNPSGYLRRMVVNECYAVSRRHRREALTSAVPAGVHLDTYLAELSNALDSLTPRRRTAVVLRYFCDLPVNEIATLMDARPSTVSSLLRRALRDLKEVIR